MKKCKHTECQYTDCTYHSKTNGKYKNAKESDVPYYLAYYDDEVSSCNSYLDIEPKNLVFINKLHNFLK